MLTAQQISTFHQTGYLAVEQVIASEDVQHVRGLLDGLFNRYDEFSLNHAMDLGDDKRPSGRRQIPEINRAIRLEPQLKRSRAFHRCREIAGQLLGRRAYYSYDHAIYKPPHNMRATPWHQDQAYTGHHAPMGTIHFWLALQDVDAQNGCMQYIPRSHRMTVLPHRQRSSRAHALMADQVDSTNAVCCPLQSGGVTIHLPTTLHYSGPNHTDTLRRAWVLIFSPYGRIGLLRPVHLMAKLRTFFNSKAKFLPEASHNPAGF